MVSRIVEISGLVFPSLSNRVPPLRGASVRVCKALLVPRSYCIVPCVTMPAFENRMMRGDRSANRLSRIHELPTVFAAPVTSANEKRCLAELRLTRREKKRATRGLPGVSRRGLRLRDWRSGTPDQASPRVAFRRLISAQSRRTTPDSFFRVPSAVPGSSNVFEEFAIPPWFTGFSYALLLAPTVRKQLASLRRFGRNQGPGTLSHSRRLPQGFPPE